DFRQQAGEYGGDGGGSRRIRVRQPEEQREDGRLDPEDHEEQHAQGLTEGGVDGLELDGEVGHVDGPRGGVDQAHGGDEQGGGQQADDHVGGAVAHLGLRPAEGDEDVAAHQRHLERHEQVEEVPGDERSRHARGEQQVDGVEEEGGVVGAGGADGVDEDGQQHQRGDRQHDRREQVHHDRDADRRRPVAHHDRDDRTVSHLLQQEDRGDQAGDQGEHAEAAPQGVAASQGQGDRGGSERDDHREERRHLRSLLVDDDLFFGFPFAEGGHGGDPHVLDVVFHLVGSGQQPAAIGEGEQEGGGAEGDDDGGQGQCLREGICRRPA